MKLRSIISGRSAKIGIGLLATAVVFLLGMRVGTGNKPDESTGDPHAGHDHGGAVTETAAKTVWTCSMHPQIKMPKQGQCPICFMDLIPLEAGAEGDEGVPRLTMSESAKALAGIRTVPVVRRNAQTDIRLSGKVELDETRVEMIAARVAGRIDRLYVDYTGVPVKVGDHLARVYSPELLSLQRELIEASQASGRLGNDASELIRRSAIRTLSAAKEKLRLLGFSEREVDRILERGTASDHMTIRARQSGIVVEKKVSEGTYVETGTPLFEIADLGKLWVLLDAYESDLPWLRLGQRVDFYVEAYPGETFGGVISFIDPVVDPQSRTVSVRVITDNKNLRLKPQMFVRAVVRVEVAGEGGVANKSLAGKWISPMHPQVIKDGPGTCDICGMPLVPAEELGYVTSGLEDAPPLLIPSTAPLFTGRRAVVYVEVENTEKPTYEGKIVLLGPRVGDHYIVRDGLAEGEQVVVNGAFKIDGELQIRAKPSMMSPGEERVAGKPKDQPEVLAGLLVPDLPKGKVNKSFLRSLKPVYDAYFELSEALAADSLAPAKKWMKDLGSIAEDIDAPIGEAYKTWRSAKGDIGAALIELDKVETFEKAREVFGKLSVQVIILEEHYGHIETGNHYLAYCPMAFNDKGAYWLQTDEQISNPYFGASMLRCGEIRETYESK